MQKFIDDNYKTNAQLASLCQTTEALILTLENHQCIPRHTYEVRTLSTFTCAGINSVFTEDTGLKTVIYYHPSTELWINQAIKCLEKMSIEKLSQQVKASFFKQLPVVLNGLKTPGCPSVESAWAYFTDGTWGKCLKELSLQGLAKKELSRYRVAEIMALDKSSVTSVQRQKLYQAVKDYIDASLDFDTYGSRHLLAEEAINKFNLAITIDKNYRYQAE